MSTAFKITKEDLFIDEYIRCKFNGAEAARRVYNIGARGGSTDPESSTARTIAAQVLARLSVQQKLKKKLEDAEMGQEFLLKHLKRIAEDFEKPKYSLQALDRIAHILGVEVHPN